MTTRAPMPDKIGRYQILETIGRGGMGVLYRGHDPILDREVAVKVMLADFSDDTEQMRPRFYREAKAAAKLQHRNIVTVFEFAEENNQPHIVMEFLRGSPVSARMNELPPLTLDDQLDIVIQLCNGLGYAHTEGIVHRDVKPANVFILQDGTVKLLDFGIAKLATSTLTRQGDVVGSAPYMSPEQIAGRQDLDGRSDVWSTGVLLYELLTGRKPFEGEGLTTLLAGILREQPPALDQLVPGLPAPLLACVAKALEKDRELRFQSAEALGRELQLIRRTLQLQPSPLMDQTRFASTNVLKALHDDRQKQDGTLGDRTLQQVPPATVAATLRSGGSKTAMIAAAAAVVLVVVAGGYFLMQSPASAGSADNPLPGVASSEAAPPIQAQPAPPSVVPPPSPAGDPAATGTMPAAKTTAANTRVVSAEPSPAPVTKTPPVRPAAAPARATVAVSVAGGYDFAVWDGSRVISDAARSHELPLQTSGKTLRLMAPDVFLDHPFRVDGSADSRFEYAAPGLGMIEIRAVRGDCKATIGGKDLGFGPWRLPAAAGDYRVDLICPDGQNPFSQVTVAQGRTARVNFTR